MERKLLVNADDTMAMSLEKLRQRLGRKPSGSKEQVIRKRSTASASCFTNRLKYLRQRLRYRGTGPRVAASAR